MCMYAFVFECVFVLVVSNVCVCMYVCMYVSKEDKEALYAAMWDVYVNI